MINFIPLPPSELLNELLEYNPDTGILTWIGKRRYTNTAVGQEAGYIDSKGYRRVSIFGKKYRSHRLIWKMVYGEDPDENKVIDHVNRVRDDNRICNLRVVSVLDNNRNAKVRKPGATGISNITWHKQEKVYRVRVKRKHIGQSKTLEGAIEILKQVTQGG
jgi:hypothetical protein